MKLRAFLLAVLLLVGCKTVQTTQPLAPGAVNATDQLLYQSLMAAQGTINSLKTSVATNPSIKGPLNQAITDYNVAEVAYQTYHAAVASAPTTSPATVQAAINKVQTDLSTVGASQ
jgi:hypothetical protein